MQFLSLSSHIWVILWPHVSLCCTVCVETVNRQGEQSSPSHSGQHFCVGISFTAREVGRTAHALCLTSQLSPLCVFSYSKCPFLCVSTKNVYNLLPACTSVRVLPLSPSPWLHSATMVPTPTPCGWRGEEWDCNWPTSQLPCQTSLTES